MYRKQFKIPEAHQQFIEQSLEEWLKLGVVKCANSLYNSPIFCVPKKQGQGLRVVQDFRELNNHSHIDKYSMKEITECIGDIGRANSTIFSTLDLTSGFWQMQLEEKSQPLTAFTIPGKGQYHWITLPMGLLGCPASFQHLMEGVMRNISNVIVYIDDLLVHTTTHEEHLRAVDQKVDNMADKLATLLRINKVHFAKMIDFMEQTFGTAVAISERLIHTAYSNRLSPGALHHEALVEAVKYVNKIAKNSDMLSFIHQPSDLFLVETSYIYKPDEKLSC